jgi:hypothetical protein
VSSTDLPSPSSPEPPRLLPDCHNAPGPQALEEEHPTAAAAATAVAATAAEAAAATTTSSMEEEVESCLDNSDMADIGDETTAAEADKENLSSSSPNIAQQQSSEAGASAGKRPSMLTVVNEKGGRGGPRPAGKVAAASGSSPAAMNSRGAMLLNLSRCVTVPGSCALWGSGIRILFDP